MDITVSVATDLCCFLNMVVGHKKLENLVFIMKIIKLPFSLVKY
jgi:hypothetical protein